MLAADSLPFFASRGATMAAGKVGSCDACEVPCARAHAAPLQNPKQFKAKKGQKKKM